MFQHHQVTGPQPQAQPTVCTTEGELPSWGFLWHSSACQGKDCLGILLPSAGWLVGPDMSWTEADKPSQISRQHKGCGVKHELDRRGQTKSNIQVAQRMWLPLTMKEYPPPPPNFVSLYMYIWLMLLEPADHIYLDTRQNLLNTFRCMGYMMPTSCFRLIDTGWVMWAASHHPFTHPRMG